MNSWPEAMVQDCGQELYFQNQIIAGNWLGVWVRIEITFGSGEATILPEEEGTPNSWTTTVHPATATGSAKTAPVKGPATLTPAHRTQDPSMPCDRCCRRQRCHCTG